MNALSRLFGDLIFLRWLTITILLAGVSANVGAVVFTGATSVAVGGHHTCVVASGGVVMCWGYNLEGELGDGTTTDHTLPGYVVGMAEQFTAVTAGEYFSCALSAVGAVKCWGLNLSGQIGDGTTIRGRFTPTVVSGLSSGVTAVAAGDSHACALLTSGGVKCWGDNSFGNLGDNSTSQRNLPVDVQDASGVLLANAIAISAGKWHTCALISGDTVKCWGSNAYGQVGDNTGSERHRATPVIDAATALALTGINAVATGGEHTCAKKGSGIVCWGNNNVFQLGRVTPGVLYAADSVPGLTSGTLGIAAGAAHSCALMSSAGAVKCFGQYLGASHSTPTDMGVANVTATVSGSAAAHTCALSSAGTIRCWDMNDFGQLGNGTKGTFIPPVNVLAVAPQLPSAPTASIVSGLVTVVLSPSFGDGGSPITGYTVTSSPLGGLDANTGSTALTHTVTGLIGGNSYTFTVVATNGVGNSATSAASNSVTLSKTSQTIGSIIFTPTTLAVGGTTTASATATSGLPVSFSNSVTPTICTVSGTAINGLTPGTCIITASQAGNANYLAAIPVTKDITVTTGPFLSFTPSSLIFADQNVGTTSAAQTVVLTNTGGAALGITSILSTIPTVFAVTPTCSNSLPPQASCSLDVTFSPAAIGNRTSAITITSNATNNPLLTVSGTGAANAPVCTLSAAPSKVRKNGTSILTPTCTPAANTYAWTGGTCEGITAPTCTVTPAVTTPYSVTGTNSFGSSTANAQVTVKAVDLTPILMLLLD